MTTQTGSADDLARRLARFRAARAGGGAPDGPLPHRPIGAAELAERLATTLGGEVVTTSRGRFVRIDGPATELPVDRQRLAALPGQPDPDRPLLCLDTETTGLATAAGTVAFCIGLGWWERAWFRQVQLLLPDHADEPALLDELARHVPMDGWLVTYNGRGFDWPLLVTRYRMTRRAAPAHAGHLDLLPIVRRVFRHRMADARLRTVELELLDLERHDDVDGWEIPERYLGFLRGGPAHPLRAVVRHNDEDVRSMARLIALLDRSYATADARRTAPAGDLAGLARAYLRARRPADALACLDEVVARDEPLRARPAPVPAAARDAGATSRAPAVAEPWWSPRAVPDFGGRPQRASAQVTPWSVRASFAAPWDAERVAADRAHLLRRLGRVDEALAAWSALAAGPGRAALLARIEVAKLREHRLGDPRGALVDALAAMALAQRRRHLGRPEPALEAGLERRIDRLRRRTSADRRLHRDLGVRTRHDQPAHPLAERPGADGEQVGDPVQPDPLDRERAGRRGEAQVRAHAAAHQPEC